MKSPALYLLEVLFCSGLLLAFYRLLLVRNVSFALCRRYLVAAVVLSLVIPALSIPVYPARTVVYPVPVISVPEPTPLALPETVVTDPVMTTVDVAPVPTGIDWPHLARIVVAGLYLATVVVSLALFAVRLIQIRRLRRRSRLTDCKDYTLAENPAVAMPFSFLRTVFLGNGYADRSRDIVLLHESSHVRHRHSVERIAVELIRCLMWFNPFVWIAQRWLQEVQEWEADRDVLNAGCDLTEYRTIIFQQLFGYNPDIACGLNHSLTKNRFAMMTFRKERRQTLLRLSAVVPVLAGMMMLCSFTTRTPVQPTQSAPATAVAAIPGLENLKPIPIHIWTTAINAPASGKANKFEYIDYLPVDNTKYLYKGMTVTDLKGTDITWWARKHYFVKAKNPVFCIDGVRMNKDAYADWSEKRMEQNRGKGNQKSPVGYSDQVYAGPEVAKLLGDPSVDALVVIETGEKTPAPTAAATAPEFHCPLQSRFVGAFGAKAPMSDYKHTGADLGAAKGAPIVAAADGTVTFAGVDGGMGNCVRIDHAWGYSTMYAHLDRIDVKQGERVRGGQTIGTVGTTGRTTGPHLHFEMAKDGERMDPAHVFDFATGGVRKDAAATLPIDDSPFEIDLKGDPRFTVEKQEMKVWADDIYVTFKGDPDFKLRCDSLRYNDASKVVECFGKVLIETGKNRIIANNCRLSIDAQGKLQYAVKESSASIYPGDNLLIEVGAQGAMRVDGIPTSLDRLSERIAAWRETIKDPGQARVIIRADQQTKMGAVTDLKDELRKAKALKVSYSLEGQTDVARMLPPSVQTSRNEHGVTVVETKIKERNLFLVLISGSGRVMAGQMGKQEIISPYKLTEQIKAFVLNTAGNAALPEMRNEEFTLPDGRKITYPVSEGIVSLQTVRDAPYEKYIEVQLLVVKAFNEIRSEVARKWFGTAFANLSEPEQQLVMRAVPLNVSEAEPRNIARK